MENLDIFEVACKYFFQKISEFKEILSNKVRALENIDWIYDKGTTKVCRASQRQSENLTHSGGGSTEQYSTIWRKNKWD